MKNTDLVVRIVLPAEQPQPPKREVATVVQQKDNKNWTHILMQGVGLSGIAVLAVYIAVGFFNLGISLNDIAIIIGIPLSVGLVTSYAIL